MSSASAAALVSQVTPVKSAEDEREYRIVTLSNELQVMLISDPETDKSAAAMDVHVGHFSDPDDLPGLAHFCEHMLFLGTEKYPDENSYSKFLSEHGGHSNAYTSMENTNYYFDVTHPFLEEALDRFSQFFVAPLFTESATDREMNAVHNENSKNLQNDSWRLFQLSKSVARKDHPFSKFGTGNLETLMHTPRKLGIDVRKALVDFHAEYYSANIMRLSVLGREPLDVLEKWVVDKFSSIRNTKRAVPEFPPDPLVPSEHLGRRYDVVPVKDLRRMLMFWPMPSVRKHYKAKPNNVLSHLIGHEGAGSILSLLKERGWANSLSAGLQQSTTSFCSFGVTITLSEQGLNHVDDIMKIVYDYIALLHRADSATWMRLWEEERDVSAMDFRFKGKESPSSYCSSVAGYLQKYAPEDALSGPWLFAEFDEGLVRQYLNLMRPENMGVHVISQTFDGQTDQNERWYGTAYRTYPLDAKLMTELSSQLASNDAADNQNKELHLPEPNPFIATDFTLRETKHKKTDKIAPERIESKQIESDAMELWHKTDNVFRKPKLEVRVQFSSSVCVASARNAVLTAMYTKLVVDSLNEYSYFATVAGLEYSLVATTSGIKLTVSGYNHKLPVLLNRIVLRMRALEVKEDRFELIRETLERSYKNFYLEQPYYHAMYHNWLLLETRRWATPESLAAVQSITSHDVRDFIPRLLAEFEVQCLVHGNADSDEAVAMAQDIRKQLNYRVLPSSCLPERRLVCLPDNVHYRMTKPVHNPDDVNSAVINYYQVGPATARMQAECALLAHILNEPCFNQLRTKEQLGYLVFSGAVLQYGVIGFRVIVQSSKFDSAYMDGRAEAFLEQFREMLVAMDDETFDANREAVIARKLEKHKRLSQETSKHWTEIRNHRYQFDRIDREVAVLRELTLQDMVGLFDRYLRINSPTRRKLSSQMIGTKKQPETEQSKESNGAEEEESNGAKEEEPLRAVPEDRSEVIEVDDHIKFRRSLPLYPVLV
eukprot:TRINITY_DN66835_c8_g9_i1.p1 TRINITY_DN66835_c8_g9~~TRINITY_DN66835_c8_g9_i1.p1  ORF type:complete len:1085 (-),score=521.06 TRINITY_DN66835_c8_g9_i1:2330-5323(-)